MVSSLILVPPDFTLDDMVSATKRQADKIVMLTGEVFKKEVPCPGH